MTAVALAETEDTTSVNDDTPHARVKPARAGLLHLAVETGCELIALAARAASDYRTSRQHDAEADRHLGHVRRLARVGAQEASVSQCGHLLLFARIDQHAAAAEHHDAHEDSWLARAFGWIAQAVEVARTTNRRIEAEITKRGWR